MDFNQPSPPSEDNRWKMVTAAMRKHGFKAHSLIETLHTVQEVFGYLDETAFHYIAAALRVPLSQVYGVATFYHFFNLKPPGEHTCVLCTGTACFIKGVPEILKAVQDHMRLQLGETTPDNKVSLLSARCVGACGLAPVAVFDGEVAGNLTPADVVNRMQRWMNHDT
ncbi:MAG TPA: bidirectional hydrogenase complex protein HoxE [bacterium]|nr:bidirectional hydrogenase complex protein HoxE [Candidatus Omnitrophota bacterium]HOJ60305.1 bidirectional hydrogenase complex protein HoxE [bacterium]HOL93685.1 bidirectional hydrogenase complex protein HoxE [bacterium]HPP02083.1 bidirectional hydrogenase complex protein HoxE [bacterium]HXK92867.1 bidirectional hydrogenase complex protein HoxE [bacterium]